MSDHASACRSLEFTGGVGFPCDCGKARHEAEIADIHGRLSAEQRLSGRLEVELAQYRDALSEILHGEDLTIEDAREIAYGQIGRKR